MFQDRSLDFLWKDFDGGVVPLIWLLPQRLLHRENWKPYKVSCGIRLYIFLSCMLLIMLRDQGNWKTTNGITLSDILIASRPSLGTVSREGNT